MIQVQSRLRVADNSGVQEIMCIRVMEKGTSNDGRVGDLIAASAKRVAPNSPIAKGEVVYAVIVRAAKEWRRPDGSYIKFDDNAAVIVDQAKNPRCTRVFGPVARELRDRRHMRIASLAPEVI